MTKEGILIHTLSHQMIIPDKRTAISGVHPLWTSIDRNRKGKPRALNIIFRCFGVKITTRICCFLNSPRNWCKYERINFGWFITPDSSEEHDITELF